LFVRYCECFAAQVYCDGCNCSNCGNNIENENMRKEAIDTLLTRNPQAFQPKIENGPSTLNLRKVLSYNAVLQYHVV
jgi:hypothetical protein